MFQNNKPLYDKSQLHKIDDKIVSYKNVKFSVDVPKNMYETILKCEKCTFFGLWDDCITEQCMDCEFGSESDDDDDADIITYYKQQQNIFKLAREFGRTSNYKMQKFTDINLATEYAMRIIEYKNLNNTNPVYDDENPLYEYMSLSEVHKKFNEWKIINVENQDPEQTWFEWAIDMNELLDKKTQENNKKIQESIDL